MSVAALLAVGWLGGFGTALAIGAYLTYKGECARLRGELRSARSELLDWVEGSK